MTTEEFADLVFAAIQQEFLEGPPMPLPLIDLDAQRIGKEICVQLRDGSRFIVSVHDFVSTNLTNPNAAICELQRECALLLEENLRLKESANAT